MDLKRKYPKSFYDDGLGDILEWIDDEVLAKDSVKAERKRPSSKSSAGKTSSKIRQANAKVEKKPKLYGDNELSEQKFKPKRVKFDMDEDEEPKPDKNLEERTRGLINRLAAPTMPYVTSEFEKLYSSNSRSSVSAAIFHNIEYSLICRHSIAKRKLVAELMLLVSYLDHLISHNIGASFIHRIVRQFETLYKDDSNTADDKRMDNIINCLVNLYYIGLISSNIIFEIAKRISNSDFKSKSVELLLLIVQSVGFQLRRENPIAMKQFIMTAHNCCDRLKENSDVDSRVEFMIESLSAIKNNNIAKMGNYGCDIDKDTIESTMKSLIKRTRLPETLSDASYDEILHSPNWYLLETRVDDSDNKKHDQTSASKTNEDSISSKAEKKICKALGFNKPAEKTIFSALLRVSDYVEASNVLIGFGLNHCSDAMLVCIHVAVHEKKYNPFYYDLVNNLCKFNRKYKMAAKFTIQDKIRVLSKMAPERVNIFKRLCFELIKSDAIPITILKSVEWADLSSSTKDYLVYLLEKISELPDEEKRKVMSKSDKKSSFAGAMRTFTNCFIKGCHLFE